MSARNSNIKSNSAPQIKHLQARWHMRQHALSAAFPPIQKTDFEALVADIASEGQLEPIIAIGDEVLDGWHRYQACEKVGVKPVVKQYDGNDPAGFVISHNLHRRHLNGGQRATAVLTCAEWKTSGRPRNPAPGAAFSERPSTTAEMATQAKVGERTIRQAKAATQAGLNGHVVNGTISVKRAAEIAKLPAAKREAAVKEKPKARKKPAPAKEVDTAALIAERDEAKQAAADIAEEMEAMQAAADPDAKKKIAELKAFIKVVERQRDDWMNQCAQLRKEVKALQRKLGRG